MPHYDGEMTQVSMTFDDADMSGILDGLPEAMLDELSFGVVGLNAEGVVELYNAHEKRYSGLSRQNVVGHAFFADVAPCMNNYLVAERLEEPVAVDITIPYVLTFRMRPTPVRLRLLHMYGSLRRWVLVARG